MAAVEFKAKPQSMQSARDLKFYECVKVPRIKRGHCDMAAFRKHPKFSGYANSALFPAMIHRELEARGIKDRIDVENPPEGVTVDTRGFLAQVTIEIN